MHLLLAAALLVGSGQLPSGDDVAPARLLHGTVPPIPISMVAGGQVFLELTIDIDGRVVGVRTLRSTPPLTAFVTEVARSWRFDPSHRRMETVTGTVRFSFMTSRLSKVLVAAVFRAPALADGTLGSMPTNGEPPDSETPVPLVVRMPAFPANAFAGGVVLVEVDVAEDGSVSDACVVESAPPFDGAAVDAARQFRFRPATVQGVPVRSYAYVLFGFPLPITHAVGK
jgi:TonB family protein